MAVTTLGLVAWWRGHPTLAAVSFGIGGALKLYPLLLLLPLIFERWERGERRGAALDAAAAAATVAVTNLPIMLLDLEGLARDLSVPLVAPAELRQPVGGRAAPATSRPR